MVGARGVESLTISTYVSVAPYGLDLDGGIVGLLAAPLSPPRAWG